MSLTTSRFHRDARVSIIVCPAPHEIGRNRLKHFIKTLAAEPFRLLEQKPHGAAWLMRLKPTPGGANGGEGGTDP
ncbi:MULTISPECIES: hypothetical protein [Ralstonia]|uniref:hypothetical protein n=1 Tax=Ralstonia TaxID=48736 RepID=UPI0013DDB847|nr:hypothetical protein [Ralstonia mannitolilytica]QIF07961.1 hypothetical protein G5A69_10035 [Ralstonia mannitolilytica]